MGSFYLNFFVKPKQQIPLQSVQISEQEYNQFLSTASLKKRINILRNHVDGEVFIRKFKKDKGVFFRLGEEDCNLLKELTAKTGLSESDVIISRLWGTILHEALTPEEKSQPKETIGIGGRDEAICRGFGELPENDWSQGCTASRLYFQQSAWGRLR